MLTGFQHLHSTLAVVLLLGLIVSVVITFMNYTSNKPYNRKIALLGLISAHLQMVVGLVYYFALGHHNKFVSGMMQDSILRFNVVEHPLTMLIAIVLITIGYSKAKRVADPKKANKTVLIFYIIGLVLVLVRIPWDRWSLIN